MTRTLRQDPYKTFRFLVKWVGNSTPIAGVNSVSALTQETEPIQFRAGNDPLAMKCAPGQTNYGTVTLERGLSVHTDFQEWAQKLDPRDTQNTEYEDDFRKDVQIILCDENGQENNGFTLTNCWVTEYHALPDLDAGANAVALESITLEHEGWTDIDWPIK